MTDFDFATQNTINHYRNRLDDIREWREQLSDTIGTITGYSMDLSGVTTNHTPRLPGGDALAMLAPYSDGLSEPDDLPHPAQIIIEGAHAIDRMQNRPARNYTMSEALHRNRTALPWLHENGHLQTWATDIDQLWHRLGRLTGHIEKPQPQKWDGHITDYADQIPDNTRLTLQEADHFNPGIRNRVEADRSKQKTAAKTQGRDPQYKCTPDKNNRYLVADLRQHHGFPRKVAP